MDMTNLETGYNSSFNEAIWKMKRLNDLQDMINKIRPNLLMWNEMYQNYNYEVFSSLVSGLIMEVYGKLSSTEKIQAKKILNLLDDLNELYPIMSEKYTASIRGNTNTESIDRKKFKKQVEIISSAELFAREMMEAHNLSAPNEEAEGGWD